MAKRFNGSTQYFELGTALVTGYPATFAAWILPLNVAAAQAVISCGNGATATQNLFRMGLDATGKGQINIDGSTSSTPLALTAGQWHHLCGSFSSTASCTIMLDGISGTTGSGFTTPTGLVNTEIGRAFSNNTSTGFFNGAIAHAAIWNIALPLGQIWDLARNGALPPDVHPEALLAYWPLDLPTAGNEWDLQPARLRLNDITPHAGPSHFQWELPGSVKPSPFVRAQKRLSSAGFNPGAGFPWPVPQAYREAVPGVVSY